MSTQRHSNVMLNLDMDLDMEMDFEIERHIDPSDNWTKYYGCNNICRFFLKGSCSKGDKCIYKHSKQEKSVVCKHWLRGLCKKGDNCEYLHEYDLERMPECWFFSKYGECSNPECIYLHIKPEEKTQECPWYARGFCKHGARCRLRHTKRDPCSFFLEGFCPDGPECDKGHPKYELPNMDKFNSTVVCHLCEQSGHKAMHCPTIRTDGNMYQQSDYRGGVAGGGAKKPLAEVKCYKCRQQGHYANNCQFRGPPAAGNSGPANNMYNRQYYGGGQ